LKERRSMPMKVLGGRPRKRRVDVGAEGGMVGAWDVGGGEICRKDDFSFLRSPTRGKEL
jgi:hypothetical protein